MPSRGKRPNSLQVSRSLWPGNWVASSMLARREALQVARIVVALVFIPVMDVTAAWQRAANEVHMDVAMEVAEAAAKIHARAFVTSIWIASVDATTIFALFDSTFPCSHGNSAISNSSSYRK